MPVKVLEKLARMLSSTNFCSRFLPQKMSHYCQHVKCFRGGLKMVSLLKLVLMTLSQTQTGEVSGGGEGGELSSQSLKIALKSPN